MERQEIILPGSSYTVMNGIQRECQWASFPLHGWIITHTTAFVVELRRALLNIGEDPLKYGGHSFRIGAATIAAEQGINDATIKLLGCWRSSAYQRYIKPSLATFKNIGNKCCWQQTINKVN